MVMIMMMMMMMLMLMIAGELEPFRAIIITMLVMFSG